MPSAPKRIVAVAQTNCSPLMVESDALAFKKGDSIEIQKRTTRDVFVGSLNGKTGSFFAKDVEFYMGKREELERGGRRKGGGKREGGSKGRRGWGREKERVLIGGFVVRNTFDNFSLHTRPVTHILMHTLTHGTPSHHTHTTPSHHTHTWHTLTSHSHTPHPHTEDEGNLVPTDISCLELPCPTPSPEHSPEPERAVVSMERAWS